ncbi:polysaccharide deacetylase [Rouxiella silvae]|uniref:Polysaccharide deacetylase n=1 Tax=Rouxiella silvae TaxID=1646373 RepID=A0AA40X4V5_9GAMM|nr:polysaccharide deacetylase [Rouxiella silvae]KQN46298.1 polysaccharide deacetylase [Serratia sp. Leaf50]MBF6638252.1 polysaccharide deacetylase [Rouxiella silvae]ORJ21735.1 polysaccharide deacetylase [Rouxiella silvae]
MSNNHATTQDKWPQGKRCAVVITVDFNDIQGILSQVPAVAGREKTLSVWRYGTLRGIDRLLALLAEKNLRSSWCVPGAVADEHSDKIMHIARAGHELATCGYEFAQFDNLSLEQQISSLKRGQAALKAQTGEKPRGFRVPSGNWAPGFADALSEEGIDWSSSWRGDDVPYFQPMRDGLPSKLVELPMHYELEDEPYFAFNLSPAVPPAQSRIASYSHTLGNMKMDFDGFYRFGLCYVLRLHPEVIGTAGRIGLLAELFDYITSHPDVWVATAGEIADWWRQTQPQNDASHPAQVWQQHTENGVQP